MSADSFPATSAPGQEYRERSARARGLRLPGSLRLSWPIVALALLVMVGVSVWLRTRALHFYFWVDEGISVGIASHPLSHIPSLMRQDGSPPLYYLLLHLWMSWRGHSEVATHEFSLIAALLAIPAAYWAAATLFGRKTGLIAALLAAGLPYLTGYAQETRMYALVTLLSILIAGSFAHVYIHRDRRYLPLFSLSLAAALYTHNWALFLGVMCFVAFLWCVRSAPEDRRGLWIDGLIGFGVVALLFLPWLPTLLYQSRHTGAPWDLPPVIWSLTTAGYYLAGGRGAAMTLLLAAGVGLVALWSARIAPAGEDRPARNLRERVLRPEQATPRVRLAAESFLILGIGTLVLAWLYAKVTPAWAPRYLAVIVGPLVLLFALGLARSGRLGLIALAFAACFWILDPVATNKNSKSNVASVAAAVRPHLRSDPLVLSAQPEQVPTLAYYLPGAHRFATPLGLVRDPRVVNWDDALSRFKQSSVRGVLAPALATVQPGQRVMLVVPVNFPKTPTWMKLTIRASERWQWFLDHSSSFTRVTSSNAKYYAAGSPVKAYVYQRR